MISIQPVFDNIREVTVTLANQQVFAFLTLGATWTKWRAADGTDLVSRYANYHHYQSPGMYLGSTIGPMTGRIPNSEFCFEAKNYQVKCNHPHLLHSAEYGFSFINFDLVKTEETLQGATVVFQSDYRHPFMKGLVKIEITYVVDHSGLTVFYEARANEDTLLNMTNHAYFNLDGDFDHPITSHQLLINADEVVLVDDDILGTEKISVDDTLFDFRQRRFVMPSITDPLLKSQGANGLDHYFILKKPRDLDLVLTSKKSNRSLTIISTYPGITIYTTNYPDPKVSIQTGRLLGLHSAIAMEPHYPLRLDEKTSSPVYRLNKGEWYRHQIQYRLIENEQ